MITIDRTRSLRVLAGGVAAAMLLAAPAALGQLAPRSPSVEGTTVYVVSPADGDTVTSPVTVIFGLDGMGIAPAGVEYPGTGHHHLLINEGLPPFDVPVPASDTYLHFGGGQTQTVLELPPGEHTLQLLLADHNHFPHEPPVISEVVTFTVSE